jgi:hypothetical protein
MIWSFLEEKDMDDLKIDKNSIYDVSTEITTEPSKNFENSRKGHCVSLTPTLI